jgi:uroporphyrinogen decarboxylase
MADETIISEEKRSEIARVKASARKENQPARSENCLKKLDRMNRTIRHEEADRIPVGDFFWGSFLERWRQELGLPADTDIYRYYDLDWIVTIPNMDPHIRSFEFIENTPDEVIVKTGYGATIRKDLNIPMPHFESFEIDTIEKAEAFEFDDPRDDRRFFASGDNQLAGVGDGFATNIPPWVETVRSLYPDFPVYGSICEPHEQAWRMIGSERMMLWMGLYPERLGLFLRRVGEFNVELARAEIEAANGMLDGMVIWGDVAYVNGMLFSPDYWREYYKPCVKQICDVCKSYGIPTIYHSDGNATVIYEDLIEAGIDAYNPFEAKAGLDVVDLKPQWGDRLSFCGNMDVMKWAELPLDELKAYVLRKLNAGKGGGFIFQSDHSVPASVSGERYDYVVKLVREYGMYPLTLGEYDEDVS